MIIMPYYPQGSIVDAGVMDKDRYISAIGQVLDGLRHLHAAGVVHRGLKPENLFIAKMKPFTVVIGDFALVKVVTDTMWRSFCGTLDYTAPEVFPCFPVRYGPPTDVWSLAVIVLEWLYGLPDRPVILGPSNGKTLSDEWYEWIISWSERLQHRLVVEADLDDPVVDLLRGMLTLEVRTRWEAKRCLSRGFETSLFKMKLLDGLICARIKKKKDQGSSEVKTPTPWSLRKSTSEVVVDPDFTWSSSGGSR